MFQSHAVFSETGTKCSSTCAPVCLMAKFNYQVSLCSSWLHFALQAHQLPKSRHFIWLPQLHVCDFVIKHCTADPLGSIQRFSIYLLSLLVPWFHYALQKGRSLFQIWLGTWSQHNPCGVHVSCALRFFSQAYMGGCSINGQIRTSTQNRTENI